MSDLRDFFSASILDKHLRWKVRPTAQNLRSLLMQPKYNPHQAKRGHNLGTLDVSHSPAPSHPPRSSGRKVAKYSVCESSSVLSRACGGESYTGSHVVYRTQRSLGLGQSCGKRCYGCKAHGMIGAGGASSGIPSEPEGRLKLA